MRVIGLCHDPVVYRKSAMSPFSDTLSATLCSRTRTAILLSSGATYDPSPGPVSDAGEVESLLAAAWGAFHFEGDDTKMSGHKLLGRLEDVRWHHPHLTFTIERHGGTVLGSTRAELHDWTINIEHATVVARRAYRQVVPRQAALDVTTMASKIAHLIRQVNTTRDCSGARTEASTCSYERSSRKVRRRAKR
jgi:hypothetical protein